MRTGEEIDKMLAGMDGIEMQGQSEAAWEAYDNVVDLLSELKNVHTHSLAEVRNGTGWPEGARFILVTERRKE